jgi:hypothetical protein
MINSSGVRLLKGILNPVADALNEEAARQLIGLRADPKTQARIDVLARKCNDGELTPAERAEYESFVLAGEFVAILQAKARLLLRGSNDLR